MQYWFKIPWTAPAGFHLLGVVKGYDGGKRRGTKGRGHSKDGSYERMAEEEKRWNRGKERKGQTEGMKRAGEESKRERERKGRRRRERKIVYW